MNYRGILKKILYGILLISIGCTGLFLRVDSERNTRVASPLVHDARDYFMYAYNLRYKHVYSRDSKSMEDLSSPVAPDAVRSPGYPLFLLFFVDRLPTVHTLESIASTQVFISTLTLGIAFLFFRMLLPVSWALSATLLTALSPHLIVANSYILSETLFCFSIVLFAWIAGLCRRRSSPWLWGAAGMTLGFASLVRPGIQYFPLAMLLLFVWEYGWKRGLKYSGMLVLGFVVIFSPWIIRNERTLGAAGDTTLMINFLQHGMYPNFTFDNKKESYGFPYRFDPRSAEIGRDLPSVLHEIERRFREEPGRHLEWYLLGKPLTFWSWNIIAGMGDAFVYPVSRSPYFNVWCFQWTHLLMKVLHGPLVILALMASLVVWFPLSSTGLSKEKIFVARFSSLLLLYSTLLHMIGAPFPRYSVPLRPVMYGMALFLPYLTVFLIKKLPMERVPWTGTMTWEMKNNPKRYASSV